MHNLQLIGVHEDGEHLLLRGGDNERFQMPVDDALRAAIRRDRPRLGQLQPEGDGGLRPRDVQALIRAGASADEVASRAGWTVEKVHRYEGPILAEREHVAGLAQQARLRTRAGASAAGTAPSLASRVIQRLEARDVEVTEASWDSWRAEGGPWTVVLTFAAGGRQRQASWIYNLADRTVAAVDDEARWLSEEEEQEAKGPIPAPRLRPANRRDSTVYDVEAEGGLLPTARDEHPDDPLDLMTAMRRRSTARGRRKPGSRGGTSAGTPGSAPELPGSAKRGPAQGLGSSDQEDGGHEPESQPSHTQADASHGRSPVAGNDQEGTRPSQPAWSETTLSGALVEGGAEGFTVDDSPLDLGCADETYHEDVSHGEVSPDPAEESESAEDSARPGQSGRRPKRPPREASRKTGRPSVPAWDEIMFGSRSGGDRSSS